MCFDPGRQHVLAVLVQDEAGHGAGRAALEIDLHCRGDPLGSCVNPFADRLLKVTDHRVTASSAMLCSQSQRASPVR